MQPRAYHIRRDQHPCRTILDTAVDPAADDRGGSAEQISQLVYGSRRERRLWSPHGPTELVARAVDDKEFAGEGAMRASFCFLEPVTLLDSADRWTRRAFPDRRCKAEHDRRCPARVPLASGAGWAEPSRAVASRKTGWRAQLPVPAALPPPD